MEDSMTAASVKASDVAESARKKAYINIILPVFLTSVIAYIDRVTSVMQP